MNRKKISKIILTIILILIVLYLCVTAYKYLVLKEIQTTLADLNESDNFLYDNEQAIWYYKDGISKWTFPDDPEGKNFWLWSDGEKVYKYSNETITEEDATKYDLSNLKLRLKLKFDVMDVKEMNIFKVAINPFNTVRIVTKDGQKCIEVKYGNEETDYFNSETKVPSLTVLNDNSSFKYEFKTDVVTDKDLELPKEV